MYVCIDMSDIILIGTPLSFNYRCMDVNTLSLFEIGWFETNPYTLHFLR